MFSNNNLFFRKFIVFAQFRLKTLTHNERRIKMAGTRKAFVMKRIGEVGMMEKPIPEDPGPNDAIIKATTALICTSDVHTVKGGPLAKGRTIP